MRGKFPQTCKPYSSPKNDIKSSLGYFHITGTFPRSFNCIFLIFREARENFHVEISPGKGGVNIHIETSPSFPQGNYEEISAGIPQNIRVEIWGKWMACCWVLWRKGICDNWPKNSSLTQNTKTLTQKPQLQINNPKL